MLPYALSPRRRAELAAQFPGRDYRAEFSLLKTLFSHMNLTVPTLYKQYPETFDQDGVRFAGFNVDPAFGDCVDGLILVDLEKIKAKKRERYMGKT